MTQSGRVVIPKTLRDQLGLHEGDEMVAEIEDGRLILSTRAARLKRGQALIQKYCPTQPGESVVDEFIAERRQAADSE
jgi:AbrB family looped-hinge helix DNA binding protein